MRHSILHSSKIAKNLSTNHVCACIEGDFFQVFVAQFCDQEKYPISHKWALLHFVFTLHLSLYCIYLCMLYYFIAFIFKLIASVSVHCIADCTCIQGNIQPLIITHLSSLLLKYQNINRLVNTILHLPLPSRLPVQAVPLHSWTQIAAQSSPEQKSVKTQFLQETKMETYLKDQRAVLIILLGVCAQLHKVLTRARS